MSYGLENTFRSGNGFDRFALDFWDGNHFREFASATSIGSQRLLFTRTITSSKVRLRITQAPVCPAISEIGLFRTPAGGTP